MKKYVFILFYLLSSFARAQLENDLAHFTQTLQNLAAKLSVGFVPPPLIPSGKVKIEAPPAGGDVKLPSGKTINVPPGTTVEVDSGITYIKLASDGTVTLPGKKIAQAPAGSIIEIHASGKVNIRVPAVGGTVKVPAGGAIFVSRPSELLYNGKTEEIPATYGKRFPEDTTVTVKPIN